MPKLKTNKAAAKRFRVTGSGKIKHKKQGLRHCLEHRSKDAKRNLRQIGYISDSDYHNVKKLLPYE
jgi:large subunit ribosomal protein L35